MIFYGENEDDEAKQNYTFKIIGGEEMVEEDPEEEHQEIE